MGTDNSRPTNAKSINVPDLPSPSLPAQSIECRDIRMISKWKAQAAKVSGALREHMTRAWDKTWSQQSLDLGVNPRGEREDMDPLSHKEELWPHCLCFCSLPLGWGPCPWLHPHPVLEASTSLLQTQNPLPDLDISIWLPYWQLVPSRIRENWHLQSLYHQLLLLCTLLNLTGSSCSARFFYFKEY